jgi:anti-sigma B factor antagonist
MPDDRGDSHAVTVAIDNGTCVITVVGDVDISTVAQLTEAIDRALAGAPREVVFDLSGVRFMDSSGLAAMVTVPAAGAPVSVRSASHIARRVIEVSGLADALGLAS